MCYLHIAICVHLPTFVHSGKNKNNNNNGCVLYTQKIYTMCLPAFFLPLSTYIYYILIPFNKARAKTEA